MDPRFENCSFFVMITKFKSEMHDGTWHVIVNSGCNIISHERCNMYIQAICNILNHGRCSSRSWYNNHDNGFLLIQSMILFIFHQWVVCAITTNHSFHVSLNLHENWLGLPTWNSHTYKLGNIFAKILILYCVRLSLIHFNLPNIGMRA